VNEHFLRNRSGRLFAYSLVQDGTTLSHRNIEANCAAASIEVCSTSRTFEVSSDGANSVSCVVRRHVQQRRVTSVHNRIVAA